MLQFLSRFVAGAAVAVAICTPAFADPQIPAFLEPLLKAVHIEKIASLSYTDEKGEPVDADTFAAQVKAGKKFHVKNMTNKEKGDALTLRLLSKEAAEAQAAAAGQKAIDLKPGDPFPSFHLTRLDGTAVDNKALEGRYTLVSFYFAGCGPCVSEVPALNALAASHKDINLLAVTFDSQAESKRFVAERHLSWPIAPDAMTLIGQANVKAYPTFALIDPQGRLVEITNGDQITKGAGTVNEWLDQRTSDKVITQAQAVPAAIRDLLKYHQEEKFSSLFFYDENGSLMDANAFAEQVKAGKKYSVGKKKTGDADPRIVFTVMSKEAIAAFNTPPSKIKPGQAFPEFHLARLDGKQIDNKALLGRYTLVSFYFAGCSPCVKEVPTLNALAEKRKDLNLLAVTFDTVADSKRFVEEHHLNWTIVPDAKKLADDAGVQGYPLFALLDPKGKLVEMAYPGVITAGDGTIDSWLDKKMAAPN